MSSEEQWVPLHRKNRINMLLVFSLENQLLLLNTKQNKEKNRYKIYLKHIQVIKAIIELSRDTNKMNISFLN
jgi:hypothetical protein